MKKIIEIILTAAAAVAVIGALLMSCGCKSAEERLFEEVTGVDYDTAYVMANVARLMPEAGCLTCVGCISASDGCSSFNGCIDCFGVTACRGDNMEDYMMTIKGCGGCYISTFAVPDESNNKMMPVYGCYNE